jgi:hypothetical protein
MVDHLPVAAGCGVMELIDHHIVEPVWREPVQVPGERLHAGEHNLGTRLLLTAVIQPQVPVRLDAAEHLQRLPQDLLAVGYKQHRPELRPRRVERRQPRLAQTGRHHHQAAAKAIQPRLLQGCQRFPLHLPRSWRHSRRLRHHTGSVLAGARCRGMACKRSGVRIPIAPLEIPGQSPVIEAVGRLPRSFDRHLTVDTGGGSCVRLR